ncbi:sensor histidine kinase [Cellulomonas soli]|uniref:sensor histidine kinase n=1 Tax=Cellulomonas soli TaxID=931535 RepID=UPI003F8426CC
MTSGPSSPPPASPRQAAPRQSTMAARFAAHVPAPDARRPTTARESEEWAADVRRDRRTLLRASAVIAGLYGLGASVQAAYIYAQYLPEWDAVPVMARITGNALAVVVLALGQLLLRVHRAPTLGAVAIRCLIASVACSLVRVASQTVTGVYQHWDASTLRAELISGFVAGVIASLVGVRAMVLVREIRVGARESARRAVDVEHAVHALQQEEVRVRRAVAEGLHSSLQQRLVVIVAGLDAFLRDAPGRTLTEHELEALRAVRDDIDVVREQDVREMSRLLYPDQLEIGVTPAVRQLLRRVPTSIAVRFVVSPGVRELDDPTAGWLSEPERLLAVRVVEEGLSNALRHANPTSLEVGLDRQGDQLVVRVQDDGAGLDPTVVHASGTARLTQRLELVGGRLELTSRPEGGARLEAWLPVASLRG